MRFLLRVLVVFVLVMAALSALRGMFSQSRLNRSGSKGPTGNIRTGKTHQGSGLWHLRDRRTIYQHHPQLRSLLLLFRRVPRKVPRHRHVS